MTSRKNQKAKTKTAERHTPPEPVSAISRDDHTRECMCGCGDQTKGGRFKMGHDMRLHAYAREYVLGERELTDEQRDYIESSGKLERARSKVEREAKIAAKTEAQRIKEGEAERRKSNK